MDIFQERQEELERLEFQMGPARGKLALALDVLTDALVLVATADQREQPFTVQR